MSKLMRSRKLFIATVCVTMCCLGKVLAQQEKHDATGFECGFIFDKFKGGKSGAAACSYNGEKVFGTPGQRLPANEHCETEQVHGYDDLLNFRIDLSSNKVTSDAQHGLRTIL